MKYFRIEYATGKVETVQANNALEVIKRYDLATRANAQTRVTELAEGGE